MAARQGAGGEPGRRIRTGAGSAGPGPARHRATRLAVSAAAGIADRLVDPGILLAWFLSFVGAPSLVGLLVPLREGGARLVASLAHRRAPGLLRSRWTPVAARALQSAAALGIAGSGLLLWGLAAGWTILGLLLAVAVAAGLADHAGGNGAAPARRRTVMAGPFALLALGLALMLELGPRGALVIWALMAAGGIWLLSALLAAFLPAPAGPEREGRAHSRCPGPHPPAFAAILLVPAALAPPYLVALVSQTPGRGLAALGSLLLASALAELLARPLRRVLRPAARLALAAGVAAAALALAALAAAAGWLLALPWLLPLLVLAPAVADRAARQEAPDATEPQVSATGLAFLAGAVLAPVAGWLGPGLVLLALAALLLLAIPALLRRAPEREGSDGA